MEMLSVLYEVESRLKKLVAKSDLHTMYIDYHKPYVSRVWFQYGSYRVYLHKIEPCKESSEALFHPHPWKSIIRILKGSYEMGIGHSETDEIPTIDCTLELYAPSIYEMVDRNGWHYVRPTVEPVYSLMITGELNDRKGVNSPDHKFRTLTEEEKKDVINTVLSYYG
jgi:hypothetical protein